MAKVTLKKIKAEEAHTFSEVRLYARKIWLAGLGAYVKELIKTGEQTEKKAKKVIDEKVDAANTEIDSVKDDVVKAKGRVGVQIDKIESAFDRRVASALNRIGIPSKHDVETLSAKLDELTALLERVARKQ